MEETTTNAGKEAVPADEGQARLRIGRRQLLRTLAASSGVVAASTLVPGKWGKPVVEVGLLPAHAQVTPAPTMTSTPTATPTGTQTPTATPTATATPTVTTVPCGLPGTPTQISPPDDTTYLQPQPNLTFVWSTVPVPEGCPGVTYGIEIQWEEPDIGWKVELEVAGLASPSQAFPVIVPGVYRWRVWATTAAGDSPRSGWWYLQLYFPV